jgi:hypothetical protein
MWHMSLLSKEVTSLILYIATQLDTEAELFFFSEDSLGSKDFTIYSIIRYLKPLTPDIM